MPGAISPNFHEGSRSEYLAQYVFTSWGTAVAVPHQEDHGLDLYCTLVERVGQRAWAKSPYTVQVKSNMEPWVFDGAESVRWLIEHPLPLFLCVVDKSESRLRVYHTSPRFYVWSLGQLPNRLVLNPATDVVGHCTQWKGTFDFSLSAPILDVSLEQLLNDAFMRQARNTLEFWIGVDNKNLDLLRAGLMRFRMPYEYKTNEREISGWAEQGRTAPEDEQLTRAIAHLAEALDCLGSQFFYRSEIRAAVKASLLYRHLFKTFPHCFDERRLGGALGPLYSELNRSMPSVRQDYLFAGIDEIERLLEAGIPLPNEQTGNELTAEEESTKE